MSEQTPLQQERAIQKAKTEKLVGVGKPFVENSHLIQPEMPLDNFDLETAKKLIQTIAPATFENYRLHLHLQTTMVFARKIGEEYNHNNQPSVDLIKLQIMALFHDVGRFVTQRWGRTDYLGNHLLCSMGIRSDVLEHLPEFRKLNKLAPTDDNAREIVKSLEPIDLICQISDIVGKRKYDTDYLTEVPTFEEIMKYHQNSRREIEHGNWSALFPSEKQLALNLIDLTEKIYRQEKEWLLRKGIDVEKIRTEILTEERNSDIKAIVFDVGGVLIPLPSNADIKQGMAKAFHSALPLVEEAWDLFIPQLQTGAVSERGFWDLFAKHLRCDIPDNPDNLLTQTLNPTMYPQVRQLTERLKQSGKYKLAIFSNTIPQHERIINKAGIYAFADSLAVSPEIGCTKRESASYLIPALKLWVPPQAMLLVEDEKEYVDKAQKLGIRTIWAQFPEQVVKTFEEQKLL